MTQKWDAFKLKFEKFTSSATNKASEFTKDAAEKAEKLTQRSKIKLDIFQIEKSRDKEFINLGKYIYSLFKKNIREDIFESDDINELIKKIQSLEETISEKENRLQKF